MRGNEPIVLLSGLPLDRKPSFLRQLQALAAAWRQQGRSVFLAGPVSPDTASEIGEAAWNRTVKLQLQLQWQLEGLAGEPLPFAALVARTVPEAVIALGYPDQFPFLHGAPLPCFLWSQFSRPPKQALPEPVTYVPLTAKTAEHLRAAGCSRIGPVIAHGVDTDLFSPLPEPQRGRLQRYPGSPDHFVLGTVANNSKRKRLDLIVRSFALFASKRPNARLLIKTDRRVSLDGVDLPSLIARENLEDRVEIIVAELRETQLAELYNRMDLYLNLSEWEGFCIPVIEAMACGVPVVSLPIQGPGEILPYPDTLVPDSLVREEEGTVLHEAQPPGVCKVLTALAEGVELRERLSREGRAAVLSRYDIRWVAALWEALL